jgi:hypothetical protein
MNKALHHDYLPPYARTAMPLPARARLESPLLLIPRRLAMKKPKNAELAGLDLPGFNPSPADANHPAPELIQSGEIIISHHGLHPGDNPNVLLNDEPVLLDEQISYKNIMHFDHDIPERVGMRAVLARTVC